MRAALQHNLDDGTGRRPASGQDGKASLLGHNGDSQATTTVHAMSEEQLKAFLEAVKDDARLQEQLKAVTDTDSLLSIAKSAGFVISADGKQVEQIEISDRDLESVTGGTAFLRPVVPDLGMDSGNGCQYEPCFYNTNSLSSPE
jgi:predicted ribosomally synthesized peptide with nif11-like leader